ncbi:MAG: DUF177 domain-containing protein [Rhizobiaceae bacterium]
MNETLSTSEGPGAVSHPVQVTSIPKAGKSVHILADETQRLALAQAHNLERVSRFEAELQITPWRLDGVRVRGRVKASIVQLCVVSLDPIASELDEPVDLTLVAGEGKSAQPDLAEAEIVLDPEGPDEPDAIIGGMVDAGAIAEEFFAIAIDPYPRKDGASVDHQAPGEIDDNIPGPFAKLAELKPKH